jgi:hypothetical protein
MSEPLVRTGGKDYQGPSPTIVAPAPNTARPAFGKSDGIAEIVRSISSHGPRLDQARPAVNSPGEPIDKELRHLDYRRSGGLPARQAIYHGPITNPQVWVPPGERRDRRG